jgi:hypothetical protein
MSGLVMLEGVIARMLADQASGASSFAGGNQPWLGTGHFTASYVLMGNSSASALAAAGIASSMAGQTTTETSSSIENRVRAVLANIALLGH